MTVTAQGHSPQLLTTLRIGCQPGSSSPPFPAPIGAGQFPGIPQVRGFLPSIWPQQPYVWQTPFGMPAPYGR